MDTKLKSPIDYNRQEIKDAEEDRLEALRNYNEACKTGRGIFEAFKELAIAQEKCRYIRIHK